MPEETAVAETPKVEAKEPTIKVRSIDGSQSQPRKVKLKPAKPDPETDAMNIDKIKRIINN